MNELFFSTPAKLVELELQARRWLGTPFVPHAMILGAGADCIHLVAGIYLSVGVLKEFRPPSYSLDEGAHLNTPKLLDYFKGRSGFEQVLDAKWLPGDTLCFHLAKVEFHVGLLLPENNFIHVLPRRRVIISSLRESLYRRRITAAYRPVL
jgi:cell wall-associated NlpC family hydrolase